MTQATVRAQLAAVEAAIDEVIDGLMVWERYIAERLAAMADGGEALPPHLMLTLEMYARNASRLGRLLRDQRALDSDGKDDVARALNQALDRLRAEHGWDV